MNTNTRNSTQVGFFKGLSSKTAEFIANRFYRLGFLVATNPWNTIIICLLTTIVCGVGLIRFRNERDPMELWVPKGSKTLHDTRWILQNIQYGFRQASVLITAPNVLEPYVLQKVMKIHNEVTGVSGLDGSKYIKWDDVCLKIPLINIRRNRREINSDRISNEDKSRKMKNAYKSFYCPFVENMPRGCLEQNILDIWKYNSSQIENLSNLNIVEKLRDTKRSPYSGHMMDYRELLGGAMKNITGNVLSAKALHAEWFLALNFSEVDHSKTGNLAGTEEWATKEVLIWEAAFLDKLKILKNELEDNETKIFYSSARSFGDISFSTMLHESSKIFVGVILMFIFIQLVLSKFSCIEMRITLGGFGLLSIGLAFLSACGICSVLGIPYGPVHSSLPFLLMGLGVDDMFVLMACWRKLEKQQDLTIEQKMGSMMQHAGAAITVTSVTDAVAFFAGAMTVLPSLQSFCLYAAVGVIMTYLYAITFFVAIFTLDEYRIKSKRNAFLPCVVQSNAEEGKVSCEYDLMHKMLEILYSKIILTIPGKILIILSVIGLTGFSIESLLRLEQKFDVFWLIPENNYLHDYVINKRHYYPESGFEASVFMGRINYPKSLQQIAHLADIMEERGDIFYNVDSWTVPFFNYVQNKHRLNKDLTKEYLNDNDWREILSEFLFSIEGGKYQAYFRFDGPLICGQSTPNVTLSWINFRFRKFTNRTEYLAAMHLVEDLVDNSTMTLDSGYVTAWGKVFTNWVTDEIIDREIYRNVGLALICVMVCTLLIIVNIQICFWIFICVLLTLVNVGGFMQRWGLTIDTVSCIGLQLAVGLCVDYAAHIGQTFILTDKGTRNERALSTILHIGAAVLFGGASTLLGVSLLSTSEAYTFNAFSKIFFLVVTFGLFHGVVLLPVILSLVGPIAFKSIAIKETNGDCNNEDEELEKMHKLHPNENAHNDAVCT